MQIKGRQSLPPCNQTLHPWQLGQQCKQRPLNFQQNPRTTVRQHLCKSAELQSVPQALLGMQQDGFPLQWLAEPLGLGKGTGTILELVSFPAPLVVLPAWAPVSGDQVADCQIQVGSAVVRIQGQSPLVHGHGSRHLHHVLEQGGVIHHGIDKSRVQRDGTLVTRRGVIHAAQPL